jgi:hypothetical protein
LPQLENFGKWLAMKEAAPESLKVNQLPVCLAGACPPEDGGGMGDYCT